MDTLKKTTSPAALREWEEQITNPGTGSRRSNLRSTTVEHKIPVAEAQ